MSDPLAAVRAATASLESAREAHVRAILAAKGAGLSNRAIGPAAGLSYEAVRLLVAARTVRK